MADSALSEGERTFLLALDELGVRYLLVGMSAALVQGARGATDDLDLWFERLDDPRLNEAARRAGGFWVSGAFGLRPPGVGGDAIGERFDVVTHAQGLRSFAEEYAGSHTLTVDGVPIRVLPLDRILVSKRAAGRPKDLAQTPSLEAALAALTERR
jgi:hypothetical protein